MCGSWLDRCNWSLINYHPFRNLEPGARADLNLFLWKQHSRYFGHTSWFFLKESCIHAWGSIIVWRFKPILSAGLRFNSHLSGGLRLRNYRAVAGNLKFSSRFSVFACFCGGYSNRVKRLRRLIGLLDPWHISEGLFPGLRSFHSKGNVNFTSLFCP